MTLPNEVREAMARAVAVAYIPAYSDDAIWAEDLPNLLRRRERSSGPSQDNPFAVIDAALSALEAAGLEVNRKGTREALALAAERLAVAASRIDRADTEFGFRVWADEARNVAGRAIVDLAAAARAKGGE